MGKGDTNKCLSYEQALFAPIRFDTRMRNVLCGCVLIPAPLC